VAESTVRTPVCVCQCWQLFDGCHFDPLCAIIELKCVCTVEEVMSEVQENIQKKIDEHLAEQREIEALNEG